MIKTNFTSTQIITMFVASYVNFFCSITVSIQAPFYPAEAEKKGATATEYGLVFGCYSFMIFITSPFFGKIIQKTSSKMMFGIGALVSSIAVTLFGLLDMIESRFYFILASFIMRIMESLGAAAATVASYSLVSCVFPDSLATVMSTLETFYGLGFIIGPTIGGLLFEVGGFPLPFFCVGILSGLVTIVIFLYVPDLSKTNPTDSSTGNIFKVITTPSIAISIMYLSLNSICQGFYATTLEPHLRMMHTSIMIVSLMFAVSGLVYALASPIVGRLVDKCLKPKYALIISSVLNIISFAIAGPFPYLPIPQTSTMCMIAVSVEGLALAFGVVGGFIGGMQSAVAAGYPPDISTYGLISGIATSSFYFGSFVGPSVAGVLYDNMGFQNSTMIVIATNLILLIILLIYLMVKKPDTREEVAEKGETQKLL